ncbi:GGDEF domain-containing phosphodiesterase [Parashewanella spongiae]|nr:GGDEF domain-containing phosphodiesterase [Parashewanella spongiae]MCL1078828.1 GGDEF domain-containing phosphodiesterase [Parashewanella spongiae]
MFGFGIDVAVTLFLCVVIRTVYKRYNRKHEESDFLQFLTFKISSQIEQRNKLRISHIPPKFKELYSSIENLLKVLPPPTGLDKLTGLMNRLGLKGRMAMLMPVKHGCFILVDIHRFRYVNDLFGFTLGDQLLCRFAERLKNLPQRPKLLARMSGAEFFMYFDLGISTEQLHQLQNQLQMPYDIKGTPISVKLKIGKLDIEEHYADVSVMLKRLDLAIIKAADQPSLFSAYKYGDDRIQDRELTIIGSLPTSLKRNELYMVYQPKESLTQGGFTQVEALIRWEHKKLGQLSPAEFIPLAERAGVIDIVSRWALEQVMLQQVNWRSVGLCAQIAVNLSSHDLCRDTLAEDILSGLERHNLPANSLIIEITESSLMEDTLKAIRTLNQLRDLGVSIAVDDFGTGHSSLAYLKQLPIDEVKIDRSFLENIFNEKESLYILEASVSLPKKLGLTVTVEGVETAKVRELLCLIGVDKVQGKHFAMPMLPLELELCWAVLNTPCSEIESATELVG